MPEMIFNSVAGVGIVLLGMIFAFILIKFYCLIYDLYVAIQKLNDSVRLLRICIEGRELSVKK